MIDRQSASTLCSPFPFFPLGCQLRIHIQNLERSPMAKQLLELLLSDSWKALPFNLLSFFCTGLNNLLSLLPTHGCPAWVNVRACPTGRVTFSCSRKPLPAQGPGTWEATPASLPPLASTPGAIYQNDIFVQHWFVFQVWVWCHWHGFFLQVTSLPGSEPPRPGPMKQSSPSWNKPKGSCKCRKLVRILLPWLLSSKLS